MSIEQPVAKRAEVDPICGHCGHGLIEPEVPHSGIGTVIDPHTAKKKYVICLRGNITGSPASGEWR